MGTPGKFQAEKLVVGILTSRIGRRGEILSGLSREFGPVDFSSEPVPFGFSGYYDGEMGPGIQRMFVSFSALTDPGELARIKTATNSMEDAWREGGERKVNLDPGLLCLSRFVLASTKESSHRVPLSLGIYAEITLVFERGTFRPVEWTYPDYRSQEYIGILNRIRGLYKAQVRPSGPA